MFIAKKYFETNKGSFKKGAEVPADIAARYARNVEEVVTEKPKKSKKKEEVKEEILTEESGSVEVETEEE